MTVEELKKLKDEKWDEFDKLRDEYNNAICGKFREKYNGQFIKWRDITCGDVQYMYVYNIWNSVDSNGPFKIPVLYFEGVYFCCSISEYADDTFMDWTQFQQKRFDLKDFNEDTLQYKKSYSDDTSLMEIITKEEYMKAFDEYIEKVKIEHHEFDYTRTKYDDEENE